VPASANDRLAVQLLAFDSAIAEIYVKISPHDDTTLSST
jgi:hypothetical protein